jgi:formiminotetrahydrofolate cyclodeaminase
MDLSQLPFTELLRAFGSSEPTPGGGSASALAGAVGASLLAMVGGLPKARVQTQGDAKSLAAAAADAADLSARLAALMNADSDAYNLVVSAFRLPKGTDEEKRARSERIQEALRAATETPLDVMRACDRALQLARVVATFGNRNASSDVGVAVELLRAALRGARLNVDVNLGSITDAAFAAAVGREAAQRLADGEQHAQAALTQLGAEG